MVEKVCPYCGNRFVPSSYHPNQVVCSAPECQRRRRREYHRNKLNRDAVYRQQCRDSQRKWRLAHPTYMQSYRARNKATSLPDDTSELSAVLEAVKNNFAVDLKACTAAVWLVFEDKSIVKNIFDRAELIVIKGTALPRAQAPGT